MNLVCSKAIVLSDSFVTEKAAGLGRWKWLRQWSPCRTSMSILTENPVRSWGNAGAWNPGAVIGESTEASRPP